MDKSSISEYILPNIPAVFIYCANSQGFSMGALYSAFQSYFDKWLKHSKERAKKCIFDLICINHDVKRRIVSGGNCTIESAVFPS